MCPDRVSNPGPLTYESGVLPTALRGPAYIDGIESISVSVYFCKITIGGLNRNMRTVYRANDAGELTICIKVLLSCLNVHRGNFIYSLCDVAIILHSR